MTFLKPLGPGLLTHKYDYFFPIFILNFSIQKTNLNGNDTQIKNKNEIKKKRTRCDIQSLRMWMALKRKNKKCSCPYEIRMLQTYDQKNTKLSHFATIHSSYYYLYCIDVWTNICFISAEIRLQNVSRAKKNRRKKIIIPIVHSAGIVVVCALCTAVR